MAVEVEADEEEVEAEVGEEAVVEVEEEEVLEVLVEVVIVFTE